MKPGKAIVHLVRAIGGNINCQVHRVLRKNSNVLAVGVMLLTSSLHATDSDSLKLANMHQQIWSTVLFNNPDSAFLLAQEHLEKSEEAGNLYFQAKAYNTMGVSHSIRGNYENASQFYLKSLNIRMELNDIRGVASCLGNIGLCFQFEGRYQESVQYFTESLEKYELIHNVKGIGDAHNNIGLVYVELGDYNEAQGYFEKALSNYEKVNMTNQQVIALTNIAICHVDDGALEKALGIYKRAITLNSETGNKNSLSLIYSQMGNALLLSNLLDSALIVLDKGLQLADELGDTKLSGAILFYMGKTFMNKGDSINAQLYFTRSLESSKGIAASNTKISTLKSLAEIHFGKGDYKGAYDYIRLYSSLNDSLRNSEVSKKVTRAKFDYEYDKKKSLDDQMRAQQRNRELLIRYFLLAIVVTVAVFVVLLYLRYKLISKQRNLISKQAKELITTNERLVELDEFKETMNGMIVHDFKNSLNTILHFSESGNGASRMKTINQAGRNMLNLVSNMLDVQKLESKEFHLNIQQHHLDDVLRDAVDQVGFLAQQKEIKLELKVKQSALLEIDCELIVRVVVNLLTNAIKFSHSGGAIIIKTETFNTDLKVFVIDNGEGISPEFLDKVFSKYAQIKAVNSGSVKSTGIGLTFCKLVVKAHGGTIGVESEQGNGSTFWFTLPLVKSMSTTSEIEVHSANFQSISSESKERLNPYLNELNKLEVFEFSQIEEILTRVENDHGSEFSLWVESVRMAIRNSNTEKFKELLET